MIEVEQRLRAELEAAAPPVGAGDWSEVLERARIERRRPAWLLALLAAGAASVAVALATPLGAAIAHRLGDFSAWLVGEPGTPVSPKEQRAFERANARSWLGFPPGTELRRLITTRAPHTDAKVELLGFRSGRTLCLRVVVVGRTRANAQSCAPLAELRQAGAPVRVMLVDSGFGKGTKHAWYGIDRYGTSALQVTAGIAADGVRRVVLEDDRGRHIVPSESNAFLYVASQPEVGQRVRRIWAETAKARVPVAFAPAPFGAFELGTGSRPPGGPTRVERRVGGGQIGWLERREQRGEPLDVLSPRYSTVRRHAVFGGVIRPDPDRPERIALTLSTSAHGEKPIGLCYWLILGPGAGGGCARRADVFDENAIVAGLSLVSGSDEFATVAGLASDDVARIEVFFSGGGSMDVPLRDNTYAVDVARARMPFRLVAYDSDDRVIGIVQPPVSRSGPGPARGRARLLLEDSAGGASASLLVGKSTSGGLCTYIRYRTASARGVSVGCDDPGWRGPPISVQEQGVPPELLWGRVRSDVAAIELRFADGDRMMIRPTKGFFLYAVRPEHRRRGHAFAAAVARNEAGEAIGRFTLPAPAGRH